MNVCRGLRRLQKNWSWIISINQNTVQRRKNPRIPSCCLVCCPCLLYNKEFPFLSGRRDFHAGSGATVTGSGLYWYLSLNIVIASQTVCAVFWTWFSCPFMIMATFTHITDLDAIMDLCLHHCLQNRPVRQIFLWWNIVYWWMGFPLHCSDLTQDATRLIRTKRKKTWKEMFIPALKHTAELC